MLNNIKNNPYRLLGVCSNATTAERLANSRKINAFLKVNKEIKFPLDFDHLITPPQRGKEEIEKAINSINLNKEMLKYALFWFINHSSNDKTAIELLKKGETSKAKEILTKEETFSSLINLGVLEFITGNEGNAIANITKVIHIANYRNSFVSTICGSSFTISEELLAQLFIDTLLEEINIYTLKKLFDQHGFSNKDSKGLESKMISGPISAINAAIAMAKASKSDDAQAQLIAGRKLMESTKEDLNTAKESLGESSPQYQMLADNLAKQILQCSINYYNKSTDSESDKISNAFKLNNYAFSIAVGKLVKDRCEDNVNILNNKRKELPPKKVEYYDRLIKIALEKFVKLPDKICHSITLIKETAPYLMSIKEVLGDKNTYYLRISTLVASNALHNIIEEFNAISVGDVSNVAQLLLLRTIFTHAWTAILYIDTLDLDPQFREIRYNPNRKALKEQVEHLISLDQQIEIETRGETELFNACRTIEDFKKYNHIFPNGKYSSKIDERLEELEFEACKTCKDCITFKEKYPNTKLPIHAKWEECVFNQCKNISQYKDYLNQYPNGKYASKAQTRIETLTFEACKSIIDYKRFLQSFPKSKFASKAREIIDDENFWSKCISTNTKDCYKEYLVKFPNGRHKLEAERKVKPCYIATMVYGDYNHPQVVSLRQFRDQTLQNHLLGRIFIKLYYKHSPKLVEKLQGKKTINHLIKSLLNILIKHIK